MKPKFNQDGYYRATTKSDIPAATHYAIIEFGSVHIPGDRRSEECPGHGYPAHSQSTADYIVFNGRDSWEVYLKMHSTSNLIAIRATVADIVTTKTVEIDD